MKPGANRRLERQLAKNLVTGHCQKIHYPIGKQKIFVSFMAIIGKLVLLDDIA